MASLPLKQPYGPTLGRLLSPRWRATSPALRWLLIAFCVLAAAGIVGVVLSLQDSVFTNARGVPFTFKYKDLSRSAPEAGGYVKVARARDGRVEDSFEVAPLRLPAYNGSVTGVLPLQSAIYIRELRSRYGKSFEVDGEGKARINTVAAYNLYYTAVIDGQRMFGRDVLITPERPGVRDGVLIRMLSAPSANPHLSSPTLVAGKGVLKRPLETFTFQ